MPADGRKLVGEQSYPRGHFHNPMPDDEVEAKLLSNVEGPLERGTVAARD